MSQCRRGADKRDVRHNPADAIKRRICRIVIVADWSFRLTLPVAGLLNTGRQLLPDPRPELYSMVDCDDDVNSH